MKTTSEQLLESLLSMGFGEGSPPVRMVRQQIESQQASTKGARLSYYASAEAIRKIQATREETGDSLSGAINTLILRK